MLSASFPYYIIQVLRWLFRSFSGFKHLTPMDFHSISLSEGTGNWMVIVKSGKFDGKLSLW
jgi:hypothetical protein